MNSPYNKKFPEAVASSFVLYDDIPEHVEYLFVTEFRDFLLDRFEMLTVDSGLQFNRIVKTETTKLLATAR